MLKNNYAWWCKNPPQGIIEWIRKATSFPFALIGMILFISGLLIVGIADFIDYE